MGNAEYMGSEQVFYREFQAEELLDSERSLVFKVFLLTIMLDGRLRSREVPLLQRMVEMMGTSHAECLVFAELWVKDATALLRNGQPIRTEAYQDHAFGHLDIET